jgi:ABC-type Mn2+/Zn2+ transport system ATPase subunit
MRMGLILITSYKMLKVANLTVNYRQKTAIADISFQLKAGELVGLFGPNGGGKSTAIKAILGLVTKDRGKIEFNEKSLQKQLKKVAYVPQRSQIDWDYPVTVQRVVMMGCIPRLGWLNKPSGESHKRVAQALERVGMWQYRQRQIGELSGGQQQRVFLARALASGADLLFFDEPFNNVDCYTEDILFEVFRELKSLGKILLVISHDLGETINNYDRLLLLNKQLIASGTKQEVLTRENLDRAYNQLSVNSYRSSVISYELRTINN